MNLASINSYLFLIGLYIGNLINMICFRVTRKKTITDNSICHDQNDFNIKWYKNISLIRWILITLDRKLSNQNLSIRYPFTEILCAGLFVSSNFAQPTNLFIDSKLLSTVSGCLLISLLLPLIIIDLEFLWLPKSICFAGIISGLMVTLFFGLQTNLGDGILLLLNHSLASFLGFILFISLSLISKKILRKEALGFGDAKLSSFLGSWLGINGLLISISIAFITAGLFSFLGFITGRFPITRVFPFAPFLASAGYLVWFFGNEFWLKLIIKL